MAGHDRTRKASLENMRRNKQQKRMAIIFSAVVHAKLNPQPAAGKPMLRIIQAMPIQCRPKTAAAGDANIALITRDTWAATLTALINNATTEIITAQFAVSPKWPTKLSTGNNPLLAMMAAPTRGVLCRIILATPKPRPRPSEWNNEAADLLAQAAWKVRRHPHAQMMHAKLWVIDNRYTLIGSHNLSGTAATSNMDASILLDHQQTAIYAKAEWLNWWERSR
jgi:phosphatidylserine/phosphatidylglycerophosphate/cardiolipin synthase-like enzyme